MILNYIKNILHLYLKPHRLNQFHSNPFIYFKAMKLKTFFNSPFSQNPSKKKPCDYFQNTECTEIILAHTLVHLLDCQVLGAITAMWLPASVEELLEEEGSNWLYLVIRQLAQTWGKGQKACVSQIMLPRDSHLIAVDNTIELHISVNCPWVIPAIIIIPYLDMQPPHWWAEAKTLHLFPHSWQHFADEDYVQWKPSLPQVLWSESSGLKVLRSISLHMLNTIIKSMLFSTPVLTHPF